MRTTTLTTLIALLTIAAIPAEAQRVMVGTARAEIRVNAAFEMPAIRDLRQTAAPVVTTRGAGYTEYQMVYTVAANARWALAATNLPQGVTLQTEEGTFQNEVGAIVTRGQATNPVEQKVTVRVATGTPATWQQNLQLELRGQQ